MTNSETSERQYATQVFYEVARAKLSDQLQSITDLDTKAATLFAYASALLAFLGAILTIAPASHRGLFFLVLIVTGTLYALALTRLREAYQTTSDWSYRPDLEWLEQQCALHPESEMQVLVAQESTRSWKHNQARLTEKANALNRALFYVTAETGFVAFTGILALLLR